MPRRSPACRSPAHDQALATVPPSATPASAGTIRYENTSSTPATRTELATTRPNVA